MWQETPIFCETFLTIHSRNIIQITSNLRKWIPTMLCFCSLLLYDNLNLFGSNEFIDSIKITSFGKKDQLLFGSLHQSFITYAMLESKLRERWRHANQFKFLDNFILMMIMLSRNLEVLVMLHYFLYYGRLIINIDN